LLTGVAALGFLGTAALHSTGYDSIVRLAKDGMVTLVKDSTGAFQGEIRLPDLHVRSSATPHGDVQEDPASGTQVLFAPGERVVHAVVVTGSNARHRACDAEWSKEGDHPLARGVFVGPTYLTTYEAALKGSA
jgi:hypothetical protein